MKKICPGIISDSLWLVRLQVVFLLYPSLSSGKQNRDQQLALMTYSTSLQTAATLAPIFIAHHFQTVMQTAEMFRNHHVSKSETISLQGRALLTPRLGFLSSQHARPAQHEAHLPLYHGIWLCFLLIDIIV